jgi:outer membrane protein
MNRTLLAASLAVLMPAAFAADLLDSWTAARKSDATFSAARNALQAGKEYSEQSDSQMKPKLNLSGSIGVFDVDFEKTATADRRYGQTAYSLTLTQPLYRLDALATAGQQEKQAALAEIQFKAAEQDLIIRVATAYFNAALADEKIRQINAQKEAVSQQLAQAKKSFEVGVATITDVDAAQASFDSLLAQEIVAQNDRDVKYQAYEQLTGLDPKLIVPVTDQLQPGSPDPALPDEWIKRAELGNYTLLSQQINLEISRFDVDKYKTSAAPTLDLSVSYGNESSGSLAGFSNVHSETKTTKAMLQLSVPLYTGGNRSSLYRQAIAKQEQQRDTVEAVRRETVLSTRKSFLGVQAGAAQTRALQQSLNSNKSLLESTRLGRDVGVRTMVDVLNAQQQYYASRYELTSARYTYLLSRLQLASAVGDLSDKDLREVNAWLR